MTRKLIGLSRRYGAALRKYLKQGQRASLHPARALGGQAMAVKVDTLTLARIHEAALTGLVLGDFAGSRAETIRRAGLFFAEALAPIETSHRTAREAGFRLDRLNHRLNRRRDDLAITNRQLKQEILQRKGVEKSLRKSEQHSSRLLEQSHRMQEQLRHLTRQLLLAQEDERKKISRELHDEIAQTLTGINVQLAALKAEATVNVKDLQKKIARTQRMVEKSVDIVHRFARDLRPTVLDDLGLIPALHSFVKSFSKQTRLHIRLTIFAGVEKLDNAKRTVLYRVAQEALTNVARHAQASRVDLRIEKLSNNISMKIKDDGKSFHVEQMMHTRKTKRLGLLGMRERVEMVGGRFQVESAPGKGTTVRAQIPFTNGRAGGGGGLLMKPLSEPNFK